VRNRRFHVWSSEAQPDGYPDAIVASGRGSPDEQVDDVLAGRADLVTTSPFSRPPRQLAKLTTRYAAQLHLDPGGVVYYLFLDTRHPPFNAVGARRALAYAVGRDDLAGLEGGENLAQPTCQVLPPGLPGYRPYCPYTLSSSAAGVWTAPDESKALGLVRASHTAGARVRVATFPDLVRLVRPLFRTLARLGYRPTIQTVSPAATSFPRTDALLLAWAKDFSAASDFILPLFTCDGGANYVRFCDRTIDAQARRAASGQASDAAAANALWAKIDRELVDRAVAVPLCLRESATVVSKRVGNYQFNPQWGPLLDQLWVR
jgi:peptide/nickel transport system substrate-binding protein